MKTGPQHLLDAHIPWYKTRRFWGVVILFYFICSLIFFKTQFNSFSETKNVFIALSLSLGSGIGLFLFKNILGIAITGLYHVLQIFLLYKTFKKTSVKLIFPLVYSLLFVIGIICSALLLSIGY